MSLIDASKEADAIAELHGEDSPEAAASRARANELEKKSVNGRVKARRDSKEEYNKKVREYEY